MGIYRGSFCGQFDVTNAAHTQRFARCTLVIDPAKFPDAGICLQFIGVFVDKGMNRHTADFFFALDYEFHPTWVRSSDSLDRIQGGEAANDMSLVVGNATRI